MDDGFDEGSFDPTDNPVFVAREQRDSYSFILDDGDKFRCAVQETCWVCSSGYSMFYECTYCIVALG